MASLVFARESIARTFDLGLLLLLLLLLVVGRLQRARTGWLCRQNAHAPEARPTIVSQQ